MKKATPTEKKVKKIGVAEKTVLVRTMSNVELMRIVKVGNKLPARTHPQKRQYRFAVAECFCGWNL
ncbi:MAG: hypothetical protein IKP49_09885, partial [Treponema sp.]|nr:hypothetical protein [Treponema sp.]